MSHTDFGQNGMVVSEQKEISEAGVSILKKGGNAVDAAVAMTFVNSVVKPFSAGLGGGGFLLLHLENEKKVLSLDFREKAPAKAHKDMYLSKSGTVRPGQSVNGHLAVAVPGTVAGLFEVHRKYGKLKWRDLVKPAIKYAEKGFEISPSFVHAFESKSKVLKLNKAAWKVLTKKGKPYKLGEKIAQKDLAKTLKRIAADPTDFYKGKTAKLILKDMKKNAGIISKKDLANYQTTWRNPVCGPFKGYEICSMGPPSSGGIAIVQLFNLLENAQPGSMAWHSPSAIHFLTESFKTVYADRALWLGDPSYTKIPQAKLISKAYAKKRVAEFNLNQARVAWSLPHLPKNARDQIKKGYESRETSHLIAVDKDHNAVSLTFTINLHFGARVVAAGTGIFLNNEMDDFSAAPGKPNQFGLVGSAANAIAPGKIPLSSMSPLIARKNGHFVLAAGAPGGSQIISTVFQSTMNALYYNMSARESVAQKRIHHQWLPDTLRIEPRTIDPNTLIILQKMGHQITEKRGWTNASMVLLTNSGTLEGSADPRHFGIAKGH